MLTPKKLIIGSLALVVGLASTASSLAPKRYSDVKFSAGFVRVQLAGARLSPHQHHFIKYDPKSRYYLRSIPDGAGRLQSLTLILSPDYKRLDQGDGGPPYAIKASLPRLTNGTGVNIGDTPQQVKRKLGAEPEEFSCNRKTRVRIYIYKAPVSVLLALTDKSDRPYRDWSRWTYTGTYEFHNEKLWLIRYDADEPDYRGW